MKTKTARRNERRAHRKARLASGDAAYAERQKLRLQRQKKRHEIDMGNRTKKENRLFFKTH